MEYIEKARKKFPKEQVQFMVGGALDALKKFSGMSVPGLPAISDLTDKADQLTSVASAIKSGSPDQIQSAIQNSGLATDMSKIADAGNLAQSIGGAVSQLDDTVKNKLDEASNLAAAVSAPDKIAELASKAQELLGALNSTGMLISAAQQFLGSKFVNPIMKPLVGKMVDAKKAWEPPSQYKAEYPHNKVTSTPTGHTVQVDDTPGQERLMVAHMNGSYIEIGNKNMTIVASRDTNLVVKSASPGGAFSIRVKSKCDIHIDGDANIKVTGNMDSEVEGSATMLVKGNAGIVVNGDSSTLVKGDAGVHAAGKLNLHSDGDMNIKTESFMVFESGQGMSIKSGGGMGIKSDSVMEIKADNTMTQKAPKIDLNP